MSNQLNLKELLSEEQLKFYRILKDAKDVLKKVDDFSSLQLVNKMMDKYEDIAKRRKFYRENPYQAHMIRILAKRVLANEGIADMFGENAKRMLYEVNYGSFGEENAT